jgi:eukaryotic-like serine/threonine-protein kinase
MPAEARDSTVPPLSTSLARLCPRCRQVAPAGAGWEAMCPEHGLAYVEARALVDSGHDPLLGTKLAGRFIILSRIGSGSMGSVYRARQAAVGRDVALKIVRRDRAYDPETKARFEREARAVSTLTSPHTVTAFDFGEAEDGSWFLALEMLEGETLGERLRRERRLDWVEALRFASEALRSLAEAHAQGIIHRDLKPDNLFLARARDLGAERETCKILDFGIAKWVREEGAPLDQLETLAGTVFGTPRYMSPEQAQGTQLDSRSDLYSLGVLLFQMLAGRAPFVDDDAVVVMAKHIKNAPPTFAEAAPGVAIPAPIEAVVRRALEKQPDARPATAEQMLSELEAAAVAARALESGVRPTMPSEDLPESLRLAERRSWVLGALLVASLLVLGGSLLFAWGRPFGALDSPSSAVASMKVLTARPSADRVAASQPMKPTVEPPRAEAEMLENSASPADNATSAASAAPAVSTGRSLRQAPPAKRAVTKAKATTLLERKGNERYGRFE